MNVLPVRAGPQPQPQGRALIEALAAALVVTGGVTLASALLPAKYVATGVGFVFLVRLSLRGLRSVDEKTRNGSAGAFGFALVFLGFALQFFGTLLGALTR